MEALRAYRDTDVKGFTAKVQAIHQGHKFEVRNDPDLMLYSGGFFSAPDKRVMDQVRLQTPQELAAGSFVFEDQRLPEMLFRYRARNHPDSLAPQELAAWEEFRFQRITEPESESSYCMEQFQTEIEELMASGALSEGQRALLEQLLEYADSLLS